MRFRVSVIRVLTKLYFIFQLYCKYVYTFTILNDRDVQKRRSEITHSNFNFGMFEFYVKEGIYRVL